ncbi:MAG: LysR family transcriptional regulator [Bacteroidetes bacterium]|nr:MAG: LysR family transcriptional regulator [Bacteroidota bacterium]
MTIQQLEYIVALDNYRHFVKAAEHCFVTQPTLSMQVKKLEEEFGVQIFDRSKKTLVPTSAGEKILLKARQIIREVKQLTELVSNQMQSMEGSFRLGVIPTLAPYLLPKFLPKFAASYPQTRLIIHEQQTSDIIAGLKNDLLDIGLLVTPVLESDIREIPLFNEPFLAFFPNDYPLENKETISPKNLDLDNLLVLTDGHCFRDQTLNICGHSGQTQKLNFDYQSGSIEAMVNLVKEGVGYTLIPELAVNQCYLTGQVKRFDAPEPVREVSLVVHKSFSKEALIDSVRKEILANIPQEMLSQKRYVRVNWR